MVVHQKDLDSYSVAEIRLVTSAEEVVASVPIPIQTPSRLILENPALLHLLNPSAEDAWKLQDAAVLIERRWSTKELQGGEILSALAHVYGLLADIVLSAHSHLRHMGCIPVDSQSAEFPSPYDRTGVLRCMYAAAETRTERFKLSTREQIVPRPDVAPPVDPNDAVYRYDLDQLVPVGEMEQLDPLTLAEKFLHIAKRIIVRDKYHQRMMFLRDGRGKWHNIVLVAKDRMEKQVLMQLTYHVLSAVAEFERELLRERVKSGLAQARRKGKRLGRPALRHFDADEMSEIRQLRRRGASVRSLAIEFRTTQYIVSKLSDGRKNARAPKN
jgi:hypothetical protein